MPNALTPGLPLWQIVVLIILAVLGSSALAAFITTRGTMRIQATNHVQSIETEVRQSLRKELADAEAEMKKMRADADAEMKKMREENECQARKLDRVTDNMVRFARNVCRLSRLVKNLLPNQHRTLADEVEAEARRLVKLLGAEFEECKDTEGVTDGARSP